jgi:hypothetical protein
MWLWHVVFLLWENNKLQGCENSAEEHFWTQTDIGSELFKILNIELCGLYRSPNIIMIIWSKWACLKYCVMKKFVDLLGQLRTVEFLLIWTQGTRHLHDYQLLFIIRQYLYWPGIVLLLLSNKVTSQLFSYDHTKTWYFQLL